ncbi:hypothetical protein M405DRAFT_582295 [Rhizopogon salebrosus TDB-379]|nr:hypothetical protein M405DRAFT_582295 [Rhizopogon salebrosus TDB-379]
MPSPSSTICAGKTGFITRTCTRLSASSLPTLHQPNHLDCDLPIGHLRRGRMSAKPSSMKSLLPAAMPPRHTWRSAFPFSFFIWVMTATHHCECLPDQSGLRKQNIPMEISFFLVRTHVSSCA